MVKIAPSVLSADLLDLKAQLKLVEDCGADYIHVDVMDGHYVPNISFGPVMVKTVKQATSLPADVHLMITDPDRFIPDFARAGAKIITVHQEACLHLHRTIQLIQDNGARAGVSLNPATDISTLFPILGEIDLVLIMTVNPGFGGQKFLDFTLPKITELAEIKKENDYSFELEVDGGISPETAGKVVAAGAEVLVAGNAIFGQPDIAKAFDDLKMSAGISVEI
jgi:ribulose-phosphate 3-epimerase